MTRARQCNECGKGMNEGYVIAAGMEYYCDDPCLSKHMTQAEYDEQYADGEGDTYWTVWEDDEAEGTEQ